MTMKDGAKFEKELTCQFKIDMTNLRNFDLSTKISKICTLMSCFLPNYIMCEIKKVQTSYNWWHWILIQNLKGNWLVLSQMTWRTSQIFVHRLKNSNIILKSKKAELNINKNLKQTNRPDAVWKLYFTFEINE